MNDTKTMTTAEALQAYLALPAGGPGTEPVTTIRADALEALYDLRRAVQADLAPLPPDEAEQMARQAEHAARIMAPPVPGVTRNAGFTIRDVIYANPAGGGLLESWYVTGEAEDGRWVTWVAYAQDGSQAGRLAYTWGHYDGLDSHAAALRDLADRAGITPITDEPRRSSGVRDRDLH